MTSAFTTLPLAAPLLTTLDELNYKETTPVQAQALPHVLAGKDVIVQARTGSGKTAAFALGLLQKLNVQRFRIQSLVLCPTRELADQVAEEIRTIGRGMHNIKVLTLCGGVPQRAQIISLEHGAHIIVGTPGRILDHLNNHRIDFSELTTLVLDEADRMLEMGFQDDLKAITKATPSARQTLLFSATYPPQIEQLAAGLLKTPETIIVADAPEQSTIRQVFYSLNGVPRDNAVKRLLQEYQPASCVVFCNTKRATQAMADSLRAQGYSALALHGDLEQKDRDQTLVQFNNRSARVLVATDVAARGLDITDLDLVLNSEIAHDTDTHVHRIGRTGRAGAEGLAVTLVGEGEEHGLSLIEDLLAKQNQQYRIELQPLPEQKLLTRPPLEAAMVTIQILGGKKHKLRPGDIVGALTKDDQVPFSEIGKIQVQAAWSYVAVTPGKERVALHIFNNNRLKGRSFRAFRVR
ncbi:ATP-dependent RNA helicase DbpA [Aliidiomarina shirensis]|uniref:ATP-dependent RNA helicase DbpA n=1 Tax=Aliidiomarina shirensis TaxID=1048642 RepID=A0A432WQG9_9GAMM|nr:ATP-dependent RNA helicase DbpA [Aliidiomarina shirensis]RUO36001.1 ATP-dependent RNA helicase DbpA [Aliidiomarina shirensis]